MDPIEAENSKKKNSQQPPQNGYMIKGAKGITLHCNDNYLFAK